MLSEQLKEATQTAHQQLEKKLIQHIKAIQSKEQYGALLSLFYGFFAGMETAVNASVDARSLPDYQQRRKAAALAEDLVALEVTLPLIAGEKDMPVITNHLQAMGALYVMEGSTLGGQIISKMVCQKLVLPEGSAMSFFSSYGANTAAMWHTFKEAINQPLTSKEEAVVIQAANETFIRFRHWFEQHPL